MTRLSSIAPRLAQSHDACPPRPGAVAPAAAAFRSCHCASQPAVALSESHLCPLAGRLGSPGWLRRAQDRQCVAEGRRR